MATCERERDRICNSVRTAYIRNSLAYRGWKKRTKLITADKNLSICNDGD